MRPSLLKNRTTTNDKDTTDDDYAATTDVMTILDTSLVKAYMKVNTNELASFLKRPNFCHVKECEKVLTHYNVRIYISVMGEIDLMRSDDL